MPITFSVNLETPLKLTHKQPYNSSEATNFKSTRITWFPNHLLNNRELKHGVTFEAGDLQGKYLQDNFTSGDFAFLTVVSGSLP